MSYELTYNNVSLPTQNGGTLSLRLTENSGRIVTRKKLDTVFGVDHPGIELGTDQYGYSWVAHHHYKNTYPTIDRIDAYADGNIVFYDRRMPQFAQREVLERALHYWWHGQQYGLFTQNCQHFVNVIAFDRHASDSMDNASDAMIAGGGIFALLGILTKNKTLLNVGLGVGVTGGATKLITRTSMNKTLPHHTSNRRLRA